MALSWWVVCDSILLILLKYIPVYYTVYGEKDQQNIDSFRGFIEKFSLFFVCTEHSLSTLTPLTGSEAVVVEEKLAQSEMVTEGAGGGS